MKLLFFVAWLLPPAAGAAEQPAKGKLLVATDLVLGDFFTEAVVLLLHYDSSGAMGLVINRVTEAGVSEALSDESFATHSGSLFWGGPVEMGSLWALMKTDNPPQGALPIVDSVHQVRIDDALLLAPSDMTGLRFFVGYAGWGPGQLEGELARGSWHVMQATQDHVFAADPPTLWERLRPAIEYRAFKQATMHRKTSPRTINDRPDLHFLSSR